MSSTEDSDNETGIDYIPPCTPPELKEEADLALNNLLPSKSRDKYLKTYETFIDWKIRKGANGLSQNVFIAYFSELAKTKKPSTLWAIYSMLKSTVSMKHNINIKEYYGLTSLLRRRAVGFKSIKSKIFTPAQIEKFLNEAPDMKYLALKVALVLGVNGACRSVELTNLTMDHIESHDNVMIIKLCDTKTKIDRMCVLRDDNLDIVKKYVALRPNNTVTNRFFLNYKDGKCTTQPIGRHKLALMPRNIAMYLNLPNVECYTGHCFRRSSATLLSDSRMNLTTLKRNSRRNSHKVTDSYVEDPVENDHGIAIEVLASENTEELYKPTRSHSDKALSFKDYKTEFLRNELCRSEADSLDAIELSFDEDNTRAVATSSGQKRKRTECSVTEKQQKEHEVETEEKPVANQKHKECEVYGRSIGHQIKEINDNQLVICQKIISDAIFFAKLNRLSEYSHIITPSEPPNLQQNHFYSPSMPSSTYSPPSHTAGRYSKIQRQSPNTTSSPSDEVENIEVTIAREESTDDPLCERVVKSERW